MPPLLAPAAVTCALALGALGAVLALALPGPGRGFRALETAALTLAGALLAHAFLALVLSFGDGRPVWTTAVGLLFLIWPGLVDLAAAPFGLHPIGPETLLWIALAVGGLTGLFDGLFAVHRWRPLGLVGFVLDVTWGLPGSANALLIHLWNLPAGRRATDTPGCEPGEREATQREARSFNEKPREARQGAHRYRHGFTPGPGFAFTQGTVMSNTGDHGPGSELFRHERVHIWQSRLAGPLFWSSYLLWMALAAGPALVWALVRRRPVGDVVQWWTYDQNPWEVMAYTRANPGVRAQRKLALRQSRRG